MTTFTLLSDIPVTSRVSANLRENPVMGQSTGRSSGPPFRLGQSECHRFLLRLVSQGSLPPLHLTVSPLSSSASRQPTSAAVTEARCASHSSERGNACVTSGGHPCLCPLRRLMSGRRASRITQDRSGTPGATSSSSVSSRVHAWL